MNSVSTTGWLVKDAWNTVVPGTGKRVLVFDLMVAHDDGAEPCPWRCEVESEAVIARTESKLVAGAGVMLRAELRGKPFVKHGVREGFSRWLAVDRIEFSRVLVAAEQPAAAT